MTDTISTSAEALEAAAMPRRRDVHTAETASAGPAALSSKPLQQKSPAEWAYERLTLYIQKFEEMLDDEHEVAMGMTGGDAGVLRIEGMGYFDPDMVTFYGRDPSGARTQLVQHVTQLNVMLRAMPKAAPQEPKPRRIGFQLAKELEDGAAT